MIHSKELRIGNLVHSTKTKKGIRIPFGVAKVLTLNLFWVEWLPPDQIPAQAESLNISDYVDIEPIPLTPEWLEKFGFTKRLYKMADPSFEKTYTHNWGDGTDTNELFALEYFNEVHFVFPDHSPVRKIEYVHQLQNLYFALTSEELTVAPLTHNLDDK